MAWATTAVGAGTANDRLDGPTTARHEGGAGIDTAAFGSGGFVAGVVADLASGTAQDASRAATLSGIENLEGTLYDDRLAGDKRTNALDGRSGADVLVRDGAARTSFVYHYTGESTSAAPDLILDFSHKQRATGSTFPPSTPTSW